MPSTICAIIPTYNRASMLRECIESILGQSRPVDRIIVVNDGSTDETQTVAQSYGERVTLINKPNGGKSSALNLALRQCKEDYVWICDDDDLATTGGLAHLVAALDANPDAGFVFGTFEIFRDEGGRRIFLPPSYWMREGEPNIHLQFLEEMFTFQFAMLVRRAVYDEVGPFREDLIRSEDYEMMLRIKRRKKGPYIPIKIFSQRKHSGLRGSAKDKFSASQNVRKWLEYDQKIFSQVRREYQLEEFIPTFAKEWDPMLARRAALVERACVFAERALWDEATADFREAAGLSAAPAAPDELRVAEAIIRKLLPWQMLAEHKGWIDGLRDCYRINAYSQAIIFAACRPLVWHARTLFEDRDIKGGVSLVQTLVRILGIRGMFMRVLASLVS